MKYTQISIHAQERFNERFPNKNIAKAFLAAIKIKQKPENIMKNMKRHGADSVLNTMYFYNIVLNCIFVVCQNIVITVYQPKKDLSFLARR